jgi:hypothetical protein
LVQDSPCKKLLRPHLNQEAGCGHAPVFPDMTETVGRRIVVLM